MLLHYAGHSVANLLPHQRPVVGILPFSPGPIKNHHPHIQFFLYLIKEHDLSTNSTRTEAGSKNLETN